MGFRDLETGWGIPSKLAEELLAWFSFFLPKTLRSEGMIMKVCALKQCDSIRENKQSLLPFQILLSSPWVEGECILWTEFHMEKIIPCKFPVSRLMGKEEEDLVVLL